MTGRRKQNPCVLCGEFTWDWDYVCGQCRRDQKLGKDTRIKMENDTNTEEEIIRVAWYWRYYPWVKDAQNKEDISRMGDRGKVEKTLTQDLITLSKIRKTEGYNIKGRLIGVWPSRDHETSDLYIAKKGVEELLCRIIQHIRNLVWYYEQKGYRDGKYFIHKLVSGEMTVKDLMEEEIKKK